MQFCVWLAFEVPALTFILIVTWPTFQGDDKVNMGLKVSAKAKNWKIKQDSVSADLVLSLGASASLIGGSAFGQDLPGYEWDGFSEDILVQQIKFEM